MSISVIKNNDAKRSEAYLKKKTSGTPSSTTDNLSSANKNSDSGNNSTIEENSLTTYNTNKKQEKDQELQNSEYYLQRLAIKKAFDNPNKKISYNAVAELSKIAAAQTSGQVTALISRLRMKYTQIGKSGGDENQIRQILTSIRKVIRKANTKFDRLQVEDTLEAKRKLAQKIQQLDLERELKLELQKKQRKRKSQEQEDILEAKKESIQEDENFNHTVSPTPSDFIISEISPDIKIAEDSASLSSDIVTDSVDTCISASIDITL